MKQISLVTAGRLALKTRRIFRTFQKKYDGRRGGRLKIHHHFLSRVSRDRAYDKAVDRHARAFRWLVARLTPLISKYEGRTKKEIKAMTIEEFDQTVDNFINRVHPKMREALNGDRR